MENKFEFLNDEKAVFEKIRNSEHIEPLSEEELRQAAGGAPITSDGENYVIDMRVYSSFFYGLARRTAVAYKAQGCTRQEAISQVYAFYQRQYHYKMEHLDACITEEFWNDPFSRN